MQTNQPKWYSIRARANQPRAADVFIYGDIGESFFAETVTAANFVRELAALDADDLTIRINSYGGSVSDGIAIYNAIRRHKAKVIVSIDGVAASIASLVAMAGDTVEMAENAMLMIHAPWGGAIGNSAELREFADMLDTWAQAMATSYAAKTGRPLDEMLALLTDGGDHYYTAAEARSAGFVDEVVAALPIAASLKWDLSRYTRSGAMKKPRAGARLAATLNDRIDELVTAERSRSDIISDMADEAGIEASTVNQILAGEINCPPLDRLEGFSRALDMSMASIQPAAESDGCNYDAGENARACRTPQPQKEIPMPQNTPAAGGTESEIQARALAADKQRRTAIDTAYAKFAGVDGVQALMKVCQDDHACTAEQANAQLLAHLGKGASPIAGGYIVTVQDETDKFRAAAVEAILARAAARDDKGAPMRVSAANPYRAHRLLDLARACLARAGVKTDGMGQMEIVAAAFTQSTSDFPVLLETTMHKTLQQAYVTQPDTWTRFCAVGSVSDFRAHPRYRVGSLGNLDTLTELGEYKNKTIPDGEKASISAGTRGNIINVSRQMIVNDDLGAFVGLAAMLGRAAKRTIEADVYALLALNSGMGPTMGDGKALFHADHGNIGAAGAISVALIDDMRVKMASQKDVSGNDFLDLRPAIWLGPIGIGGEARVINDSQFDPDTANKLQRPNKVRGLFRDVVDTPRLTGTRQYVFADPNDAPVLEVAFLDGVQDPFLELQNGFDVDGARYKVRLDYGTAGIDFLGAVTAAGA